MTMPDGADTSSEGSGSEVIVTILEARAVDEMVAKLLNASAAPDAAGAVELWLADHPGELWASHGHDHAVIGNTLMYLHDAPDGTVIPHVRYRDGREQVYTDLAHAEVAYRRD